MNDQTVTPNWTLTRVSQVDGRNLSLTCEGKSEPALEITIEGKTTLNTPLTVNGPLTVTQAVTASGGMQVSGGLAVTGPIEAAGGITGPGMMPKGAIIMWAGDPKDVPAGWALCDGSHGTPDMRAKFPVGADGGSFGLGKPGGKISHQHAFEAKVKLDPIRSAGGTHFQVITPGEYPVNGETKPSDHLPPYLPLHFITKL
ncbi:tail fiber protein [Ancylobacter sp. FA202]|uniref:tail fiber protein n=1 Tax=Ancylobacter sp. FA202 TaxID=1111106 RepID=UPI0003A8836D|nr:tail fiber protein [Ancylobacter sp. FA202]